MKSEKNILVAFLLNLAFSIFEFVGGIITGSVAIISDSIHDIGDSASIGIAYIFEKKSKRKPDEKYTYGYARYSLMGSVITTLILLVGSGVVIYNAILRIITPVPINYNGMIIFAIFGVLINFVAAILTHGGHSLNQKAVSLHMLEDVLGWIVVLVGAVVMRFTDFAILDALLSICVAVFIFINAFRNLKDVLDLFLEKTPKGFDISEIKKHILMIDGVKDVHHMHLWSIDGEHNYATMHIVTNEDGHIIKKKTRKELAEHGIIHVTLELEKENEECYDEKCNIECDLHSFHHHHHH